MGSPPFDVEFDTNAPVLLNGTITKVDWADPHIVVQLGIVDAGGADPQLEL
jgi:hypothetical protein